MRILSASRIIGIRAILVHALDEDAARFWRENEFIECPVDLRTFYLPVETITQACPEPRWRLDRPTLSDYCMIDTEAASSRVAASPTPDSSITFTSVGCDSCGGED